MYTCNIYIYCMQCMYNHNNVHMHVCLYVEYIYICNVCTCKQGMYVMYVNGLKMRTYVERGQ